MVTANAYYIHPIIRGVAEHFDVSETMIGMVPSLNQFALALGIFLLLPLGDWISNRRLVTVFTAGQFLSILGMTLAQDYTLFLLGSTVLGFFTIAPYLIPAYVSKRIEPENLGHATAIVTTGIILGILIARAGAGVVAENFGWRTVYIIATSLMLIVTFAFPYLLERGERSESNQSYLSLLASLPALLRSHSHVLLSGTIQGLSFGAFLCIWLGISFHLTSPEMGYGKDVVGYLAILAMVNMFTTPRLGRWADAVAPRRARFIVSVLRVFAVLLFFFVGHSLWLLMIPILFANIVGPIIDVTGRMTILSEAPEVRTRLMTAYIILMFIGGGLGSWGGPAAYDWAGWYGSVGLAFGLSVMVMCLCAYSFYSHRARD